MSTQNFYVFCFDLNYDDKLNTYLPSSYIIENPLSTDYVIKKVTPIILESFGIVETQLDDTIKKLLLICEVLKPDAIFKKFAKNSKSVKNIADLLKDTKVQYGINQFIKTNMNQFYTLVSHNNIALNLNLSSHKDFNKTKINIAPNPVDINIHFNKNENGITYTLLLTENDTTFYPSNCDINLLLDEPGWLIINKNLYLLNIVNTKKITPFLKKKTIEIPQKMVGEYFEKFIKDVVKKVSIEATGFDVIEKNTITNCNIDTAYDFLKNKHFITLTFDYDGYVFDNSKPKRSHSEIDISNLDDIKVIRYNRSHTEAEFEKKLQSLGLIKNNYHLFEWEIPVINNDPYEYLQWAIENQENIKALGFNMNNLSAENKKVIIEKSSLQTSTVLKNDWFDIHMVIHFEDFSFNFFEIIDHIKNKERLYLLPNGNYFLIPLEWMKTYLQFTKLVTMQNGKMVLPKNNYAVLEEISNTKVVINQNNSIKYQPSTLLTVALRPYQIDGVQWLLDHYSNNLGACLADDMGLGKTIQTLATLVAVQEQLEETNNQNVPVDLFGTPIKAVKQPLKALVILPSSLVFNWYNEAKKFTPHFTSIQYTGNQRKKFAKKLDQYDLIFSSYAIVSRDIVVFEKFNFHYLILDESQYIKNKDANIFKAINQINTQNKLSLSGTPIENSLDDLWSQMQFINPNILGSYNDFVTLYKNPIQKQQDENALVELKTIIKPFILRRTKEQVLKDLPPLSEQVFYCDMEYEQEKLYEEEKSKARNFLLKSDGLPVDRIHIINTLMRLRQLSNHPKMIDAGSNIESGKYITVTNYLSALAKSGQKTIIFSSFISNLDFYINWCKENNINYCELTGQTQAKDREIAVNTFQNNENPLLFFISLKAGGVGLNITKASYVLFLDPWWNPFVEKQGIARAHRMGQENKVNVIRFITRNTIEEKIIQLQENKTVLAQSLLDDDHIELDIENNLEYILS